MSNIWRHQSWITLNNNASDAHIGTEVLRMLPDSIMARS